ncbi:MAG: hypothetical protein BGO99_06465 [Nitrosospira sp. 56-18]|jgi:hypothetical protein|nr:MAG: hypothetical protein BGO99_06465 [Nitrosospira sp. 56-18]
MSIADFHYLAEVLVALNITDLQAPGLKETFSGRFAGIYNGAPKLMVLDDHAARGQAGIHRFDQGLPPRFFLLLRKVFS